MGISYYQRSKLAQLLGISKETLRYYEEKNIVSPKRDPKNAYRVYDSLDCQQLIYLRMLRAYGFSIDDSISGDVFPGSIRMEEALEAHIADNERQIRKLERQQRSLEDLRELSRRHREETGVVFEEEAEETVYFLEQLQGWAPLVDDERNQAVRVLTAEMPVCFYGMTIDRDYAASDGTKKFERRDCSGIFWLERDMDFLSEEVRNIRRDREYRWKKIWRLVYDFSKDEPEDLELCSYFIEMRRVIQRIHDAGYRLAADVVVRLLPISINEQHGCVELIFPIEKQ